MGLYVRENRGYFPSSIGDLLSALTRRAFEKASISRVEATPLLQRLAVLVLRRNGAIPFAEVGTREECQKLSVTGFITEEGGSLRFSLDILTEWFAYEALVAGEVTPEEISGDLLLLERWFSPLSIFISEASHDQVSTFITPIVRQNPRLCLATGTKKVATNGLR